MMMTVAVLGASGDVGRGIVSVLLERGHAVIAIARDASRLTHWRETIGNPEHLRTLVGSVASDSEAAQIAAKTAGARLDAVVVSVNAPRRPAPLLSNSSASYAALIEQDLVSHFAAARAFIPRLESNGILLGIGGGSADFVLNGGIPQSNAQAALRMLYRGLAEECRGRVQVRELIVASVVNGVSNRDRAQPAWVTDREIGAQVAAMIENPAAFNQPIWRIARRDESGRPVVSHEGPSRVQGFAD
jgi:NAD(P)-dependent dehydrogenase (short-subunit alcohol dehydrogenase family)